MFFISGFSLIHINVNIIIVCPPLSAGEIEPPTKFSQREGFGRTSTLGGGCQKRGRYFFQKGGVVILLKK